MERGAKAALFIGGVMTLLLSGFTDNKSKNTLLRPPGALNEPEFLAICLRCGKCAEVCPQRAIKIGQGNSGLAIGTPYLMPREAACDLCLNCIGVCSSGALRSVEKANVRMGLAEIDHDACLAWLGDECKICYTSCPFYNQAIKLENHKRPVVDKDVCVGCGVCEHVCIAEPAAIKVQAGKRQ
ncbi:4Fe-4S dicluster domain-containing protein [Sporomusa sp. KB1]|jgi:MauM/NapG family ferredoxin protein|uniref:4Fe-4S dicluster domain-containing protein n=1 Tax=Sporomusa sp. KB1 TaxID=943346 RepID=UPI0011A5122F|nr:4Fe-4S dicluster domain-containing protein [Sporomusa sp. KB1]TWH47189.1 ferredoxin-type protein NapG/ferredoxin-type protein NapH [Sporomusa sp. KB1]